MASFVARAGTDANWGFDPRRPSFAHGDPDGVTHLRAEQVPAR